MMYSLACHPVQGVHVKEEEWVIIFHMNIKLSASSCSFVKQNCGEIVPC